MNAKRVVCLGLLIVAAPRFAPAAPPDVLGTVPTLKSPSLADVREQARAWLDEQKADAQARAAADAIWRIDRGPSATASPLDRLAATFALVAPNAKALVELCGRPRAKGPLVPQEWLAKDDVPPLMRNNMRLYYGRWLSQQALYDESLEQLAGLEPADVVDPASLLFFQSVAHHRLLNKDEGLKAIARLLGEVENGPSRYLTVAGLMREDLKALEDDSLDHISRRMDDIRRRLDLGRAGDKVRKEEDGVVASLDKLIEEMEKQQQQQQGGASSGGSQQPQQAMPDSRLARANAPGNVDRKSVGRGVGWGDLPAKDREEALQQIGKDFPSHYRDVIEEYFRKLATEEEHK
ncbi:MAG: hypothetical protein HYX69_13375 [Planctomycetia bacterium]|nr:hypothetical protein [Planctomycetia bacterium]